MEKELLINLSFEEIEEAVLGSLLIDEDALIKVVDFLKPDDFLKNENKLIYQTILDLFFKKIKY